MTSHYEENFLWKNLLISVVAVRLRFHCFHLFFSIYSSGTESQAETLMCALCLRSALPPLHPAALPAALAGDPARRKNHEERSVLQVTVRPPSTFNTRFSRRDSAGFHGSNFHRISLKSKHKVEKNLEEGLNEDEDVQMERTRVKNALSGQSHEEVS